MSTITCNEEMKGNSKCKNSRFEPPFGGLRGKLGNAHVLSMATESALWTSYYLLSAILASSHGCDTYDTIKRTLSKSGFSEGVGHFERQF